MDRRSVSGGRNATIFSLRAFAMRVSRRFVDARRKEFHNSKLKKYKRLTFICSAVILPISSCLRDARDSKNRLILLDIDEEMGGQNAPRRLRGHLSGFRSTSKSRPNMVARAIAGLYPQFAHLQRTRIAGVSSMAENIHYPGTMPLSSVPQPFRDHIRAAYHRIVVQVSHSCIRVLRQRSTANVLFRDPTYDGS